MTGRLGSRVVHSRDRTRLCFAFLLRWARTCAISQRHAIGVGLRERGGKSCFQSRLSIGGLRAGVTRGTARFDSKKVHSSIEATKAWTLDHPPLKASSIRSKLQKAQKFITSRSHRLMSGHAMTAYFRKASWRRVGPDGCRWCDNGSCMRWKQEIGKLRREVHRTSRDGTDTEMNRVEREALEEEGGDGIWSDARSAKNQQGGLAGGRNWAHGEGRTGGKERSGKCKQRQIKKHHDSGPAFGWQSHGSSPLFSQKDQSGRSRGGDHTMGLDIIASSMYWACFLFPSFLSPFFDLFLPLYRLPLLPLLCIGNRGAPVMLLNR